MLFLMAGASRQQGDALLNLFYPDHDNFGWDCSPVFRRCWRLSLAGIVSASPALAHDALAAGAFQLLLLVWQPLLWMSGESPSAVTIGLLAADLYALWWLLSSRRLKACFREEQV